MSVQDGQNVNAAVTNAALMSRLNNTSTIGRVDVNNTTDSTLPTNGAVHTTGGAGVEKSLNVGENLNVTGNAQVAGTLDVTGATTLGTLDADSGNFTGTVQANDLTATDIITGNSLNVTATANVGTDLTVSGLTQTQTLDVDGASTLNSAVVETTLGVTGNTSLSTVQSSGLATVNSLDVTNNADVGGNLQVDGNTVITGNLTVNGTTTTVNSTVVEIVDPTITLNNNGNDTTAEGSGITIERTGTNGSLIYKNTSASKFAAGPLGSEIDLVGVSGAQALTDKTIDGSLNTLTNLPAGSLSGTVPIANGGTGQTTQTAAFDALAPTTTKGDLIVHNGTDNIRLPIGTNGQVPIADSAQPSGIRWGAGGGGGGGGSVNFISNGDAEDGTSIWVNYNDRIGNPAVDRRPVDGSCGSPTVSNSITTGALRGTNSVLLTKPASDCQGQGWSTPNITIPLEFRGKPLSHYLAYLVQSGTFVAGANGSSPIDGDLIVYWYDVTNGKTVESSNIKFFASSTTIVDSQTGSVQFDSNCTTVRMLLHIASQNTAAWNLTIDSAALGPVQQSEVTLRGPVGSIIATGSVIPPAGYLYANGTAVSRTQFSELFASIGTAFGSGDGSTTFNLPDLRGRFLRGFSNGTGRDPDAASRTAMNTGGATGDNIGSIQGSQFGSHTHIQDPHTHTFNRSQSTVTTNAFTGQLGFRNANLIDSPSFNNTTATNQASGGNETRPINANVAYHICFSSGSVKISEPGDSRPFLAHAYVGSVVNAATFNFGPLAIDSHGGWNGSTTYKVQSSRRLIVTCQMNFNVTASAGQYYNLQVKVNGTVVKYKSHRATGAAVVAQTFNLDPLPLDLKAGDEISFGHDTNFSSVTPAGDPSYFTIFSTDGSQQISAGELVAVSASQTSAQSFPHNTRTIINWNVETIDTHGRLSGTTYTALTAHTVEVSMQIGVAGLGAGTQFTLVPAVTHTGLVIDERYFELQGTTTTSFLGYPTAPVTPQIFQMRAGDTITASLYHFNNISTAVTAFNGRTFLNIKRIG